MPAPLIIVSNRLPISVKKTENGLEFFPSVGGLATGLASYTKDKRNKWIGWPGIPKDELSQKECEAISVELRKSNCYPVFLTQKQLDDFYNGYSNSILWPLFHDLVVRTSVMADHDRLWRAYKAVNSAFAGVVLALSDEHSTIWVHDYQLLSLPALLRAVRPRAKIGFFLHIPFPGPKFLGKISSAKALLLGMLGSDLIGMHTRRYTANFTTCCHELTKEVVVDGQVMHGSHLTRITDFPMGIDYERFAAARNLKAVKSELRKHRAKYRGKRVILTVDRLDPTKGLAERLEAYQTFLRQNPKIHKRVVMVMLAVPSRTDIEEYKALKLRVEQLVKDISDEFGTARWQPVDYQFTSMPVEAVTALYQVADIAFITPIRDGMNLVAKEYIASRPKRDGVLILSSTAGAAQELTDALLVNPKKPETLVEALNKAVKMPRRELRRRITRMHDHIASHTVQDWAKTFMGALQQPIPGSVRHVTKTLNAKRERQLVSEFRAARHPAVLLDYDGVLARHIVDPSKAAPSAEMYDSLQKLSQKSDLAVISGRSKTDLVNWLGELPIGLVAEHGATRRSHGGNWRKQTQLQSDWQADIQPILQKYADQTPGAHLELKEYSLVWHYRGASPYYSQKNLVILRRILKPLLASRGLAMHNGNKILEVKPSDVDKGMAAKHLAESYAKASPIDFLLCIGDDYTDEDMFEILPSNAYTIKVGRGATAANWRIKSAGAAQELLRKLAR